MKNTNIIISVIIVLCIAVGVTAYSAYTSPEDNVITNLQKNLQGDDNGDSNTDGDSDEGDTNSGTDDNSDNSGSDSNTGSNSGSGGSDVTHNGMSKSKATSIGSGAINEEGASAGEAYWDSSNQQWIVPVIKNGKQIAAISVDPKTGATGAA